MKLMNIKSEEEIIGKTDIEIYKNEAGEHGYTEDMNVLKTGKPLMNHEECFIDPDGNNRWLLTTKLPLYNERKQIIGLVGMGHDITARKQSEEQLLIAKDKAEESDRLKTAFLHNISHEIRTPMNAIVGFSGFLNDPGLPSEKRKHFTEILVQSSNQLLSIITDIINISTIETGQVTLIEKAVNINYLMKIVYEQFSIIAEKKGVIFQYKTALSDHAAIISTDNTKLIEILSNLLSNALKFTKQGHVNFGYLLKEDYLEFYVEDTGIGIPPKMHDEIFKRFRQMETTVNRKYGGSGLGLSISKAYVELLGGKIWVHSELTKGAVFYFTIPYKKISLNKQSEEQFSNSLNQEIENPATILIAEDEDSNYLLMEELLSDLKCINIRAVDGLEAVKICKSNPNIDLVLMDIKMPEMDGYEATRQIRKFNPTVPIIAQTAHALADDRDIAFEAGCTDYISKPINGQLLIEMVRKYLYQEKKK
jgi:signal transduction histidine kinase/CheY-like chemotaxis protein